METSRRGRSLFGQLVLPVVGLVLAAVLANMAFAAWLEARRSQAAARAGRERVVEALTTSRVALTPPVLETLRRLTGCEFVAWDPAAGSATASTLEPGVLAPLTESLRRAGEGSIVSVAGRRHQVGIARGAGVRPEQVLILTPVRGLAESTLAAIWPILAVAAATLAVLVPLGISATRRLATRIAAVERHVEQISRGDFGAMHHEADDGPQDEVARLVTGVNRMSWELQSLRATLAAGERQRLLGQLAAGFAHEFRNAITGARLAVDLHRRRCPAQDPADKSLDVACRQLDVMEEEVRGLLALGRPAQSPPTRVDLDDLVAAVCDLVGPRCAHAGVRLDPGPPTGVAIAGQRDSLRAALVNLALNGIDAAGAGGSVRMGAEADAAAARLVVEDTGPGPPPDLAACIQEPFVTGKAEGIGLGLTVVQAVAAQHGGTLAWSRGEGRTRFVIALPWPTMDAPTSATKRSAS